MPYILTVGAGIVVDYPSTAAAGDHIFQSVASVAEQVLQQPLYTLTVTRLTVSLLTMKVALRTKERKQPATLCDPCCNPM